MGMEEEVQCQYLRRVEVHADLKKKDEQPQNREKKDYPERSFYEKKNPQCSSWEEA